MVIEHFTRKGKRQNKHTHISSSRRFLRPVYKINTVTLSELGLTKQRLWWLGIRSTSIYFRIILQYYLVTATLSTVCLLPVKGKTWQVLSTRSVLEYLCLFSKSSRWCCNSSNFPHSSNPARLAGLSKRD